MEESLWCGKAPEGAQHVVGPGGPRKLQHQQEQQQHWNDILSNGKSNFKQFRFEDAAIMAARESGNSEIEALIMKGLAAAYSGLGLHDKMVEYEEQALKIARQAGDIESEGRSLCRLANIYRDLQNTERAIECAESALNIAKRIGDGDMEHECYFTISVLCSSNGQIGRAVECGKKALQRAKLQGNKDREGSAYGCLGIACSCSGEHEQAAKWHEKFLSAAQETQNLSAEAQARGYLGAAYLSLEKLPKALEHFDAYVTLSRSLSDTDMESRALLCRSRTFVRMRQSRKAVVDLEAAVKICKESGTISFPGEFSELLECVYWLMVHEVTESTANSSSQLEGCVVDLEIFVSVAERMGEETILANSLNLLVSAYMAVGDNNKALETCNKALELANSKQDSEQSMKISQMRQLILSHAPLSLICSPVSAALATSPGGIVSVTSPQGSGMGHFSLTPPTISSNARTWSSEELPWDKSFKTSCAERNAEAAAEPTTVCGSTLLPTFASSSISYPVLSDHWTATNSTIECRVRLVKVKKSVSIGVKQATLKLGRAWHELKSDGKVWYVMLSMNESDGIEAKRSNVFVSVQSGRETLFSHHIQHETDALMGKSLLVNWDQPSTAVYSEIVVSMEVNLQNGTIEFWINEEKLDFVLTGLNGEIQMAVQFHSSADKVEILRPSASRKSGKSSSAKGLQRLKVEDRVKILKEKGNLAFKSQDFRHAVQIFSLALKLAPDNHILYSNRSAAHLALKHHEKALGDAESALKLKPDWSKGYLRKGDAMKQSGRLEQALEAYREGLAVDETCQELVERVAAVEKQRELEAEEMKERERQKEIEESRRAAEEQRKRAEAEKKAKALQERERKRLLYKQARQKEKREMQMKLAKFAADDSSVISSNVLNESCEDEWRPRSISLLHGPEVHDDLQSACAFVEEGKDVIYEEDRDILGVGLAGPERESGVKNVWVNGSRNLFHQAGSCDVGVGAQKSMSRGEETTPEAVAPAHVESNEGLEDRRHADVETPPAPSDPDGANSSSSARVENAQQTIPARKWKQRSIRWRDKLAKLASLQDKDVRSVGEIVFSADVSANSFYHIDHGAKGTLVFVGLHKNGTECAIKRMQRLQVTRNIIQEEVAALNHAGLDRCPYIVAYEADAQDENFEYLALQLCEWNLEEYVQEHGCIREVEVQAFARDMLQGLAWLARANQVHRDIKPRNLLLDTKGRLLLADFGLVREIGHNASSVHSGEAGTMGWMATEVLAALGAGSGGRWKHKSDVQVAGMVIFYMLTGGKHPFGSNAITTQFNILQGRIVNLELLNGSLLARDAVEWMLTPDVDSRPTAMEVLECHPYFWTLSDGSLNPEKCANFVAHIAMTHQCRHPDTFPAWHEFDTQGCQELFAPHGDWNLAGAINAKIIANKQRFQQKAENGKEYVTSSACDLLRLIRNILMHHTDDDRALMGRNKSAASYITSRDWFPALLARIFKLVRTSDLRRHPDIINFCSA